MRGRPTYTEYGQAHILRLDRLMTWLSLRINLSISFIDSRYVKGVAAWYLLVAATCVDGRGFRMHATVGKRNSNIFVTLVGDKRHMRCEL